MVSVEDPTLVAARRHGSTALGRRLATDDEITRMMRVAVNVLEDAGDTFKPSDAACARASSGAASDAQQLGSIVARRAAVASELAAARHALALRRTVSSGVTSPSSNLRHGARTHNSDNDNNSSGSSNTPSADAGGDDALATYPRRDLAELGRDAGSRHEFDKLVTQPASRPPPAAPAAGDIKLDAIAEHGGNDHAPWSDEEWPSSDDGGAADTNDDNDDDGDSGSVGADSDTSGAARRTAAVDAPHGASAEHAAAQRSDSDAPPWSDSDNDARSSDVPISDAAASSDDDASVDALAAGGPEPPSALAQPGHAATVLVRAPARARRTGTTDSAARNNLAHHAGSINAPPGAPPSPPDVIPTTWERLMP